MDDATHVYTVPNGLRDDEALADLAGRFLAMELGDPVRKYQILVGRLPTNLPLPIPLPAQATLVGSIVSPDGDDATILLDAPGKLWQIKALYRDLLVKAGWERRVRHVGSHRVVDYGLSDQNLPFTTLTVRVRKRAGQSEIELRISKPKTVVIICGSPTLRTMPPFLPRQNRFQAVYGAVRRLTPPEAGSHRGHAVCGLRTRNPFASMRVETTSPLAELTVHYTAQLTDGGWTYVDAGRSEALTWSTWHPSNAVDGGSWQAGFSVLRLPWASGHYRVDCEAICTGAGHAGAGPQASNSSGSNAADRAPASRPPAEPAVDSAHFVALLKRLVHKMGADHLLGSEQDPGDVQILPRRIPVICPVAVPCPPLGQLLGSVEAGPDGARSTIALFSVACDPDEALATYRQHLLTQGWLQESPETFKGLDLGIVDTQDATYTFRHPEWRGALTMRAREDAGGSAELSVGLLTDFEALLAEERTRIAEQGPEGPVLLPELGPPAGAIQTFQGGTWNHAYAHQRGRLYAPQDFGAVIAHYTGLLATAGWMQQNAGTVGVVSWSIWTIPDAEHAPSEGRLLIVRSPFREHEYTLEIQRIRKIPVKDPDMRMRTWHDSGDLTLP